MDRSIITVTTPAASFDLTTKAAVKADLGITVSTYDTLIDGYITACSLQLAAVCHRVFAQETVSEKFRFEGTRDAVVLSRNPVNSITSVTEDDIALTTDDWELDKNSGLLYRLDGDDGEATWCARKLVVVYQAGWSIPASTPADLAKAAIAMVKAQYLSRGRDPLVRSESVPGVYEVAYWVGDLPGGDQMSKTILSSVAAYRNMMIGGA